MNKQILKAEIWNPYKDNLKSDDFLTRIAVINHLMKERDEKWDHKYYYAYGIYDRKYGWYLAKQFNKTEEHLFLNVEQALQEFPNLQNHEGKWLHVFVIDYVEINNGEATVGTSDWDGNEGAVSYDYYLEKQKSRWVVVRRTCSGIS